jgi:hypothetical protein
MILNKNHLHPPHSSSVWLPAVLILLALGLPATAEAAPPAGDEYGANFPNASGKKEPAGSQPVARPDKLPPSTVGALGNDPQGQALIAAATAEELGAPSAPAPKRDQLIPAASDDGKSALTAVGDAVGSLKALLVMLGACALLAIGLIARRGQAAS